MKLLKSFTPNQIVPGQKYKHRWFPGSEYTGEDLNGSGRMILRITKDGDNIPSFLGNIVQTVQDKRREKFSERECAQFQEWWNQFEKID